MCLVGLCGYEYVKAIEVAPSLAGYQRVTGGGRADTTGE